MITILKALIMDLKEILGVCSSQDDKKFQMNNFIFLVGKK
jgi:hypothetical protein